jgi:hypothetical protein
MGLVDNTIVIRNVTTKTTTVVVTLPQYATLNNGGKGHMDDAWKYWAGFGVRPNPDGSPNWDEKDLICVDLTTGMLAGLVPYNDPRAAAAWLGMSPSGEYIVVVNFDLPDGTYPGSKVYARDFSGELVIQPTYSHGDFAIDAQGQEHYVYFAENGPDCDEFLEKTAGVDYDGVDLSTANLGFAVVAARLSDGRKRILTVLPWDVAAHASGLASRQRPYVLLSTYSAPTDEQTVYAREIFWLALDGSGTIVRVAHHHSDPVLAGPMGKDYFAEPQAIPSMDGSLVVWCSVWGDEFTHYDTYVMRQPWR